MEWKETKEKKQWLKIPSSAPLILFFIFVTIIFVYSDIEWPRDELENLFEVQRGWFENERRCESSDVLGSHSSARINRSLLFAVQRAEYVHG